jgi:transposase
MNLLSHYAAIVGIDWADRKHDLCVRVTDAPDTFTVLDHCPDAIDTWAMDLRARFGGKPIAVCIESRKVPLIYALLKYDFLVLFPVNPQTLARYRRALRPSRAKDDPSDAQLLVDLVLRHPERFSPWQPERPEIRALTQLLETRRRLVADKVRCTNRLTATLKLYFPQALEWFRDKDTLIFCQFIERWPSLEAAQRARESTLRKFFVEHNARHTKVIDARIEAIKTAIPLTNDPGVIEPNRFSVLAWVHQLALLLGHIRSFDQEIAKRFAALEDAPLFQALPGAGAQLAPRLLVAFGEDRSRYATADALCQYAGIAPVTERSVTSPGCIGASVARSSFARALSNGPTRPYAFLSGRGPFTGCNANEEKRIRWPSGRWPSSGFGSCGVAGKIALPTMKRSICWR